MSLFSLLIYTNMKKNPCAKKWNKNLIFTFKNIYIIYKMFSRQNKF